jgi:hypothetical protein
MDREAVALSAMRRIFSEFMHILNGDERAFVMDMLQHLQAEAVHPREGALSDQASRHLREYLQDEMSISFLAAVANTRPPDTGPPALGQDQR